MLSKGTLMIVMGMFLLPPMAWAQSLSDIDLEDFQKQGTKTEARPAADPFRGGAVTAEDLSVEELTLHGIVMNAEESYALISGYLVRAGDLIAGFRVSSIEAGRVVLKRLDEVYVLPMGKGI